MKLAAFIPSSKQNARSQRLILLALNIVPALWRQAFVEGCVENKVPFPAYLSYQINFEVNRFVKSIWAAQGRDELLKTLTNLKEAFISNLSGEGPRTVNTRANAIYYISRIPLEDEARKVLEEALMKPSGLYTKNGILFALVRLGDRQREKELYGSFTENKEADAINRGLHLVYFKDWIPTAAVSPYMDDGKHEWHRTLAGMMGHVESNETRFINSRRLDIYIIRSFLQPRGQLGPFTRGHLDRIKSSVVRLGDEGTVAPDYFKDIMHEFLLLERLADQLR